MVPLAGGRALVSRRVDESQRFVEHRAPGVPRTATHLASERLVTEPLAHETDRAVVHVQLAGRDAVTREIEMIGERAMETSRECDLTGTRRQRDDEHHARVDAGRQSDRAGGAHPQPGRPAAVGRSPASTHSAATPYASPIDDRSLS